MAPRPRTGPSEREWQQTVCDLLDALGWRWFHVYPLQTKHGWRTPTTAKGIPDLVALRGAFVVAIEVKGQRGTVGADQLDWLARFSVLAGGRAWLLRPSDDLQQIAGWLRDPKAAPRAHGFTRR